MMDTKLSSLLYFIIEFMVQHILPHICKFYIWKISDIFEQATLTISYTLTSEKEFKSFSVDNFVMIQICPKWFSQETVKDLHACSARLFKILKNLNYNTYVIDLTSVLFSILKTKWFTRSWLSINHPVVNEPYPDPIFWDSFTFSPPDIYPTQQRKLTTF